MRQIYDCCRFVAGSAWLGRSESDEAVIFRMGTDPYPNEIATFFDRQGAIMQADPYRPKIANAL